MRSIEPGISRFGPTLRVSRNDKGRRCQGGAIDTNGGRQCRPISKHALTREILWTERLRVKAILVTLPLLLAILLVVYAIAPDAIGRIWHGHLPMLPLYGDLPAVSLFELSVLRSAQPAAGSRAATCPMRAAISAP